MIKYQIPSVGVEEEYQLVDPATGELMPNCKAVMQTLRKADSTSTTENPSSQDAEIQHELHLNQIEMASDVCHSLADVRRTLQATRQRLVDAANENGCDLASAGTNALPLPDDETLTPKDRYRSMTNRFQQIARDLLIFGCHVHVDMPDRELGVRVMNRCRRWLPLLQAITSNSPFWDGMDTGYASYRRELWAQWPMAGPPPHFKDSSDYEDCVDELIKCGAIRDESYIYWDIRLPTKVPTIEFRAADVLMRIEETVGYVGLVRAMVMQATADEQANKPCSKIRPNVMSYAIWHAARYGTTAQLVDPESRRTVPAEDLLDQTMLELSNAVDATGERQPGEDFVSIIKTHGTGADRQRAAAGEAVQLADVVRRVVAETAQVGAAVF
jgi:carboxylate-amine ligase